MTFAVQAKNIAESNGSVHKKLILVDFFKLSLISS